MRTQSVHISPNTLQGSLQDVSVSRLLASCQKCLVTGRIDVDAGARTGWIELRAGIVEAAAFGQLDGGAALSRLRDLGDGAYELSQRLPNLDGKLGSAASFSGDLRDVSLVELMRHCEANALPCTIVIIHEFDRGEVEYRGGDIARVSLNGVEDEDRIVDMVRLENARFLVSAPPLDVGLDGWPVVRGDPTAPFRIEHLALRPLPRSPATAEPASPALPGAPPVAPALPGAPPAPPAKPALPGTPPPPPPRARFRELVHQPVAKPPPIPRRAPTAPEEVQFLEDLPERPPSVPDYLELALVPASTAAIADPPPNVYYKAPPLKRAPTAAGKRRAWRRKSWLRRLLGRLRQRLPI